MNRFHQQQIRIGSDICFVPNRRQAIIWTKDGLVYPRIYASPYLNELDIESRWLWSLGPKHHGYWYINFLADAVYGLILPNVRLYYSRWPLRIPCIMLWIHPGYASDESRCHWTHYSDVIMSSIAYQITGVLVVLSTFCLGAYVRKHQSSASLVFARAIHWWPANFPQKGPVTRKMFPFDDVTMFTWEHLTDWELRSRPGPTFLTMAEQGLSYWEPTLQMLVLTRTSLRQMLMWHTQVNTEQGFY